MEFVNRQPARGISAAMAASPAVSGPGLAARALGCHGREQRNGTGLAGRVLWRARGIEPSLGIDVEGRSRHDSVSDSDSGSDSDPKSRKSST